MNAAGIPGGESYYKNAITAVVESVVQAKERKSGRIKAEEERRAKGVAAAAEFNIVRAGANACFIAAPCPPPLARPCTHRRCPFHTTLPRVASTPAAAGPWQHAWVAGGQAGPRH